MGPGRAGKGKITPGLVPGIGKFRERVDFIISRPLRRICSHSVV